jgi:two-component system, sensor histidine kinase and response regulator
VIAGQLKKLGIIPRVVSNGQEALEQLEQQPFDVLLMDCQMPVMDGFTASQKIREREIGSINRLHIIALTANAMQGTEERCLDAGMDAYITKPLNFSTLVSLLKNVQLTASTNGSIGHSGDIIDTSTINDLRELSSDTDMLGELIDIYVSEAPSRLAQINNAISFSDMQALAFAAHTLRGSSSTLGATKLAKQLDHLEIAARANDIIACDQLLPMITSSLDEATTRLKQLR